MSEDPTPEGRLLDLPQVAKYLGLTTAQVQQLRQQKAIPFIQFVPKGRLYFDVVEIDRWIARSTTRPKAAA